MGRWVIRGLKTRMWRECMISRGGGSRTVDLTIEIVFAIAVSNFPARCNASITSLLPDIFELAKFSNQTNGDVIKYCNDYSMNPII